MLAGREPNGRVFQAAAQAALADAEPSGDNAYKIELARRIVVRALVARRRRHAAASAGAACICLRPNSGVTTHA